MRLTWLSSCVGSPTCLLSILADTVFNWHQTFRQCFHQGPHTFSTHTAPSLMANLHSTDPSSLSCCCEKNTLAKATWIGRKGLLQLPIPGRHPQNRKEKEEDYEAAGHITLTPKSKEKWLCPCTHVLGSHLPSLYNPGPKPREWRYQHWALGRFSHSVNIAKTTPTDIPTGQPYVGNH